MAYDKLDYTQIKYDDSKYRERLIGLRQDNDLKQKQVATFLGIARSSYSDYENGRTRIPVEYLVRLAAFYNVDINYICGITNEKLLFLHEDRASVKIRDKEIIITRRKR